MKMIFTLLLCSFTAISLNAQNYIELAESMCDSIGYVEKQGSTPPLFQANLFSETMNELIEKEFKYHNADTDYDNLTNVLTFKLDRELKVACNNYTLEGGLLLPGTRVLDIENLFKKEERIAISRMADSLSNELEMELLVVAVDQVYPEQNVEAFGIVKGILWNTGGTFTRGGAILILSRQMQKMALVPTALGTAYLEEDEVKHILENVMQPYFEKDLFTEAVRRGLIQLSKQI